MGRLGLAAVMVGGFAAAMAGSAVAAPSMEEKATAVHTAPAGMQVAAKKMPVRPGAEVAPQAGMSGAPAAAAAAADDLPPSPSFEPTKRTLSDCMKTWDKDTHMSKAEWKAACIRGMKEAEKQEREAKAEYGKRKKKAN